MSVLTDIIRRMSLFVIESINVIAKRLMKTTNATDGNAIMTTYI